MNSLPFNLDGTQVILNIQDSPSFNFGKNEQLSSRDSDITFGQVWYQKGYTEEEFIDQQEFRKLKEGLTRSIEKIVKQECKPFRKKFCLEQYHQFVDSEDAHFRVVNRTRDLFSEDFDFQIKDYIPRLANTIGYDLTDIEPYNNQKLHIIVRINRPLSNDYNPPHKDIYEPYDQFSVLPKFINFWIPICGVNQHSNLPIVPGSHLINEKKISRTFNGVTVNGNQYRVRTIKSWEGANTLIRSEVTYGQALIFSSYLIHGLGFNANHDITRVALEFRLFKA